MENDFSDDYKAKEIKMSEPLVGHIANLLSHECTVTRVERYSCGGYTVAFDPPFVNAGGCSIGVLPPDAWHRLASGTECERFGATIPAWLTQR